MKLAIIGAGKWGMALRHAFSIKNSVYITSLHKRDIDGFIPIEEALSFEYIIMTIPAQFVRDFLNRYFKYKGQKILVAAKGIEIKSGAFLNEVYEEFLPKENLAYLSGPSFAAEVMKSLPTALVVSSLNKKLSQKFVDAMPPFIKGYIDDDIIGAEVGGAYKNVIAIAAGICDGLELGNNARAALISRGLVEMSRFGVYFGAKLETFLSLGGAGDLFLTASSKLSRNYRVGFELAKKRKIDEILEELKEVAEGVWSVKALMKIAKEKNIYLPIAREVDLIIKGKDPKESLMDLLKRN
ncbi:MAG: NAD(P)H-dependent glycerol-3-phosphate dehydrogenase [Epsilonproteobacteria bacterium]|nr:NAD(P)H-dependent glycerol-3-phosphate dehydrogenase [Campylobacterota bacterium]